MRHVGELVKRYTGDTNAAKLKLGQARVLLQRMKAYLGGAAGSKIWKQPDGSIIKTTNTPGGDIVEIFVPSGGRKPRVIGAILLFGVRAGGSYLYSTKDGTNWSEIQYPVEVDPYDVTYATFSRKKKRFVALQPFFSDGGTYGFAIYSEKALALALSSDPQTTLEFTNVVADFRPQAVVWVASARRFRAYGFKLGVGNVFYESEDGVAWSSFACSLSDAEEMNFAEIAAHPKTQVLVAVSRRTTTQWFLDTNNAIPGITGIRSFNGGVTWGAAGLPPHPLGTLGPIPMTNIQYARNFQGGDFIGCAVTPSNSGLHPMDLYIFTLWSAGIGWSYNMFGVNDRHFSGGLGGASNELSKHRPAWSPRLRRLVLGGSHLKTPADPLGETPAEWYANSFIAVSDDFGASWTFVDVPANEWMAPIWSDEIGLFVIFGAYSDNEASVYDGPAIEHHCLISRNGYDWTPVEIPGYRLDGTASTGARRSLAIQFDLDT